MASAIAALTPAEALLEMMAIGTLFAIVCAAVLILRRTDPDHDRPFRVRWVYAVAPLGIIVNVSMMLDLNLDAWIGLGLAVPRRSGGVSRLRPHAHSEVPRQREAAASRASPAPGPAT